MNKNNQNNTLPSFETPLAERMRPKTLDEYRGHNNILSPNAPLRKMLETGDVPSCILYGPPGVGKTALVRLMARVTGRELFEINAVSAKVSDLRALVEKGEEFKRMNSGIAPIAFVDEMYHFNKTQQNALLPSVERGDIILVGTTTENPWFEINKTLLSRLLVFQLEPLDAQDLKDILKNALTDVERGLGSLSLTASDEILETIAKSAAGDGRQALTRLDFVARAVALSGGSVITQAHLEQFLPKAFLRHDRASDDHYAVISAFIKSMRGSDPDASVYWLARLLDSGEDVRFVARRMMILAAEDIGLADPNAINIAASGAYASDMIGMPEAQIILSEVAIYLACAPKSNSSYMAIKKASSAISKGDVQPVPSHLINGNDGYVYPHDDKRHWVPQTYLSEPRSFYKPGDLGYEPVLKDRLSRYWRRFRDAPDEPDKTPQTKKEN